MSQAILRAHPTNKFDTQCTQSESSSPTPIQCGWSPYMDNGGSICAIAGQTFTVIGADTRTSQGYSILSRNQAKWIKLTDTTVLATGGMRADIQGLWKVMQWYVTEYTFKHKRQPSTSALAQQLSNVLFSRRFFPYYALCILGGLDEQGRGIVYGYDAVGSHDASSYAASGAAASMLLPILDDALEGDIVNPTMKNTDECAEICFSALASAGEREITVGDSADLILITKEGVKVVNKPLKQF